ncbi:MAG TPA: polysaccharide biosynthesis/export family protein, partial [Dokdonella sp.]
ADGKISGPLVGDIDAGGRTPEEVAAEIKEKLATYVRDPQVTVILTQLRSHEYLSRVRVTGAVRQPVSVPYRQGMTVLDAVLAAGGTNEFAASDRTELYRKEGEGTHAYAVRLDQILQKGELTTNYPVQPGDVITVPERTF